MQPPPEEKRDPQTGERWVFLLLFSASLVLYLATLCWAPCPGLPAKTLRMQLGLDAVPPIEDFLWGVLVRGFARLPWLPVSAWSALFSALCGAFTVGLTGRLMLRVGYRGWKDRGPAARIRERQARFLSALVSGLYLACCIPFWMLSTRSLAGTFHLGMLVLAAWFFSEFQQRGRKRHLFLLGLLFGVGITEFSTFILFIPVAAALFIRELFRQKRQTAWQLYACILAGLALGLLVYPVHALWFFRQGAPWGLFASPWPAWMRIVQEQLLLILQVRFSSSFILILLLSTVPWLMVFAMSRRSPWFYEFDQVGVRLVLSAVLMAVLFNAFIAPWKALGMTYPLVTPYLLLAVCMGFMTGELWIMGEPRNVRDASQASKLVRLVPGLLAGLVPGLVLLAGALNWSTVNGRHVQDSYRVANQVLDRLKGRDILFASGVLEDVMALAIFERRAPVRLVCMLQTTAPLYLRQLAGLFGEEDLKEPLAKENFDLFVERLLLSDAGVARTAILDMPDAFRPYAYLVPNGFFYGLETSAERVDLAACMAAQQADWEWMAQVENNPAPMRNLARPFQDQLRWILSRSANNLGVMQAESGDEYAAEEAFQAARRINPDNLSALLNLKELARGKNLPQEEKLDADWEAQEAHLETYRWALAPRFGYVWHAHEWIRRGWVWAMSGVPSSVEAERRLPALPQETLDERAQFLDQVYLQMGKPPEREDSCLAQLYQNGSDTAALMTLSRLALRRNDPDAADAYRMEAVTMGLPEMDTRFDQAMASYVRGDAEKVSRWLEALTRQTPNDARIWMALAMLTPEDHPLNRQGVKYLGSLKSPDAGIRLGLSWIYMSRRQWAEAQAELEAVILQDNRNAGAWELLYTLARVRANRRMEDTSLQALLSRNSRHRFLAIRKAYAAARRGEGEEAISALHKEIQVQRCPELLAALADILLEQDGDRNEIRNLLEEARRKQPFNPLFRCMQLDQEVREGNWAGVENELAVLRDSLSSPVPVLLIFLRHHLACGERQAARELAKGLAQRQSEMTPWQKFQSKQLFQRMQKP